MNKDKLEENHCCDNVNCNHNNTKGLCCMFNPDVCKYRQLQKEYTELKKACDETQELLDKQIEATYKLDKENAELKKKKEKIEIMTKFCKFCKKMHTDNLTKAKEIIKKLYSHVFQGMDFMELNDFNVLKAEAEQFLNEVEK